MSQQGPRVFQMTTTSGTGPFSLTDPAPASFQRFKDVFPTGAVTTVVILEQSTGSWQESLVSLAWGVPDTLTVLAVISSSNSGNAVAFTGSNKIVMQCQPSYGSQATDKIKSPVRVATSSNFVLSSLAVGAVIDGVTLAAGDRVGLFGQTTVSERGIWIVPASGSAARSSDFLAGDTVSGAFVAVRVGTLDGGKYFVVANEPGSDIVGTSTLSFVWVGGANTMTGPSGSTTDAIAVFADASGQVLRNSTVKLHGAAHDKLDYAASFGAVDVATYGSTITFDFNLANYWEVTLTGSPTLAFTNASVGQTVTLVLNQDATGSRVVTWWSGILWNAGLVPTFDITPSGWDMVVLDCIGLDGYGNPIWLERARRSSALTAIVANVNASLRVLTVSNKSTGNAAITSIFLVNDAGNTVQLQIDGSGHATAPHQAYLAAGGSARSLMIAGDATSGPAIEVAPSQTMGFFGATPVAQRTGAAQAAVPTTPPTNITPYGFSLSQATAIVTLVNELRAALVALGAIRGS